MDYSSADDELDPGWPVARDLLTRLHSSKSRGYGDAWRKRGELLSIFTNLARKYDRLVVSFDQDVRSSDESPIDTVADLCIYSAKYLTWLAEREPMAFDARTRGATSGDCSDADAPDALGHVLSALELGHTATDGARAWLRLRSTFERLDAGLMAQAEDAATSSDRLCARDKVALAWEITAASAVLLLALAAESPASWKAWKQQVMELS